MRFPGRFLRVVLATLISCMTLTLIAQTPAAAADGDLDTSFSTDGVLVQDLHASGEDGWESVVFDGDGNLVAGGWWNNNGQTGKHSWAINRHTSTGACTNAVKFDNNCGTQRFWSPRKDHISEMLVQPNGKIVAVGSAGTNGNEPGGDYDCTVTRFGQTKDFQSLDAGFGTNGIVRVPFESAKHDWCKGAALDSDNKIIVVGYVKHGGSRYDATIARLNTDGSLDTTFDSDGMRTEHFDHFAINNRHTACTIDDFCAG